MKIRSLIISAVMALIAIPCATAQSLTLEKVLGDLAAHKVTNGDFIQEKEVNSARGKRTIKSYGTFIFAEEGIVWNTTKPFPSAMIITSKKIIQTSADGSKSVVDGTDNSMFESIASSLTAIFSGDANKLKEGFNIAFKKTSASTWEIVLTPKDSTISSVMTSLVLKGSSTSSDSVLEKMVIMESGDSAVTYSFENQKYKKELTGDEKAYFTSE